MFNNDIYKAFEKCPDHKKLMAELLKCFYGMEGITGAFLSGSGVTGKTDEFSDIDLGFLCQDEKTREKIWSQRWNWPLPNWFHRFDADHVKAFFIIYFFYPNIHVDLPLYVKKDLPPAEAGPFLIIWDKNKELEKWQNEIKDVPTNEVNWNSVVHEDERFWAWLHYCSSHIARNENYCIAMDFDMLRNIVENWHAKLNGLSHFNSRYFEQSSIFLDPLRKCFPGLSKTELKEAMLTLIHIQKEQRQKIKETVKVQWKTSETGIDKIENFVKSL